MVLNYASSPKNNGGRSWFFGISRELLITITEMLNDPYLKKIVHLSTMSMQRKGIFLASEGKSIYTSY